MTVQFKTYTFNENEHIGKGAFGSVIGGSTPRGTRVVAKMGSCFGEEAHMLDQVNKLRIPHVIPFLDSGVLQNREVIVLGKANALDMDQILAKDGLKAFDESQIVSCIKQLFEALAQLKTYEIQHRDLKPANLVYEVESGQLRIVDWGRACWNREHSNSHRQGTLYCLAPEIFLRQEVSKYAVDVWAAGVVLFMMYTGGHLPFRDADKVLSTILTNLKIPSEQYLETCAYKKQELASKVDQQFRRDWRGMIRIAGERRNDDKKRADLIIDLLERIFCYDDQRISPADALKHPLFENDVHLKLDCKDLPKGYVLSIGGLTIPLTPHTNCFHIQNTRSGEYPMTILDSQNKGVLSCKEKLVPGSKICVSLDPASKVAMKIKGPLSLWDTFEETKKD